ncbi:glycosyltransferase family 2 protein [Saccharicrinis sp. FJH2]|uniref:glycosyltransferase family 2 protein n=1 Tax=Saccharicrinis sp. FJH65 TaxID=3344659 RepID=UPI0035F31943
MNITAIIPTKNRHELLKRAINSVIKQTESPNEIIVIDGSVNLNTVSKNKMLCDKYGFNYIKQDYNNYNGVSGARNQAVLRARNEYISFLDDDDVWLENYLDRVKREIDNGYNLIFTGIYKKKGKEIFEYKIPPKNITIDDLLVKNPGIQGSNVTVKKAFFNQIHGFDDLNFSHIFEDNDFMLRALFHPKLKYKSIPEYLIIYYSHTGNRLSMTKTPDQRIGIEHFYQRYKIYMSEVQREEFIKRAMKLWQTKIIK